MCTLMFQSLNVLKDIVDSQIKGSEVLFMINYINPDNPVLKELCSIFCVYFALL